MTSFSSKTSANPIHRMGYWLRKLYLLERMKSKYLKGCDFSAYKKACFLQEKIVLYIQSPFYRKKLLKEKNSENKNLSLGIRKQVYTNQVLLEDIKNISMKYLEPLISGYYDREGNMRKTTKIFTTEI